MKDPLSDRLQALGRREWLALLATMSLICGAAMALVAWVTVSLVFSFAYLDWTNAMTLPKGRAAIAVVGLFFAAKAWVWVVDMRNKP